MQAKALALLYDSRGDWIRTSDLLLPKQARYQATLRPGRRRVYDRSPDASTGHGANPGYTRRFRP